MAARDSLNSHWPHALSFRHLSSWWPLSVPAGLQLPEPFMDITDPPVPSHSVVSDEDLTRWEAPAESGTGVG